MGSTSWGLLTLAVLGALLGVWAPFGTWYRATLIVWKAGAEEDSAGITHFGAWGIGFGIGIVVLALVTLVAVVTPERLSSPLSFAALRLAALLVADLVVMAVALSKAELVAGEGAASMVAAANSKVTFHVYSERMSMSVAALSLLGLAAAQLPRQDLAPRVLAGIGATIGLLSLVLPWVVAYVEVDGDLRVYRYWAFTAPAIVVGFGFGLVIVIGLAAALALLPRAPVPVLVAAIVIGLAMAAASGPVVSSELVERQLAGEHVLSVDSYDAVVRSGPYAGILLTVAGVRLAWRRHRTRSTNRSSPPAAHLVPPGGHPSPPVGYPAPPAGYPTPAGPNVVTEPPPGTSAPWTPPPWTTTRRSWCRLAH